MEGEKFFLTKAQEEAEELKQKKESGEALSYSDAEKIVEQDTKKREAIASQVGLNADSKLVQVLSSLDQDARDEIISSLSDEAQSFRTSEESMAKPVLAKIFSALNNEAIISRIQTPEDFRHYADKVVAMAKTRVFDQSGKVYLDAYGSTINVVKVVEGVVRDVQSITALSHGNVDRDLDTVLQIMRYVPDIISFAETLSGGRGLIRSSENLERVGQFVKRLSEHGFSPKTELSKIFGTHSIWDKFTADGKKLDDALSVIEAAFTHGANPEVFAYKTINSLAKEEREQFIALAEKFAAKEIPPQFVAANLPLLQNCDFSKDGLGLFPSFEAQKKWLEYCVEIWVESPQNTDNIAKFFNEALTSEIKTKELSTEDLSSIRKNKESRALALNLLRSGIEQLFITGNFKMIEKIQESINGSAEVISAIDQEEKAFIKTFSASELIDFICLLGDREAEKIFPMTFGEAKEVVFASLDIEEDLADYFVENLNKYYQQSWVPENILNAIQHYSVAQKFIYAVENGQTKWKDEVWVADVFAKAKTIVEEHQEGWQADEYGYRHGTEGFSEKDPYENHPWLFGGKQIRISSVLAELMTGQADNQKLKELGITGEEINTLLVESNKKVETAYQNFLEQVRSNPNIKEEDKQSLLNPELGLVRMTPLLENVRAFIARYFVQSVDGDVTRLSEIGSLSNDLDRIITEGFERYIKIHEVDVPLYDKLYEEFDNLRETGRYPLEVFLGRDGIYAWIGRRAQDVARRRKMGLEGRKKLKEIGEVIEIHPQYIVYPRYFRDNLNYETKRQFLEQEGISPEADPLFYDTGYTGTIPEQIMKVMDFEDEDIEKRIRLLSAPSVHRRVKGISENARSEVIEYIEHNAKLEETAEGLIADEKTGKIRHIAKPTSPEEQFYFMMVKQAVERHYWLQEKLHHEPSGNVNLDSEHYAIRIRQDYAKLLPQEFLHDPKTFFAEHGELMKGSKGEGEYPDEEVTLFKLTDGTEVVAKRIELRKAKEARKEFAILIAAKKAGLPTAEPVGFLSSKEDADGSYLLMKKLEGRSGRKFEKELREAGKYSDEQIKDIMKRVAEKNREMAELFRATLNIDKRWRIKDTIIEFNEETGEVESVLPIDWERAQNYNPNTPKEIDEIT